MKKILVVLLVLAVAGGVFAQEGEWSFNGAVEMGAVIDLDPIPGVDDVQATSSFTHYNRLYDGYDGLKGKFGVNYSRDGFTAGVTLQNRNPLPRASFDGILTYGGENFNFAAEGNLGAITGSGDSWNIGRDIIQLWGNYTFLDGLFFLEAAYVAAWKGDQFWVSDKTGAFRGWDGRGDDVIAGPFVDKHTFTMTDGDWEGGPSSYIAADVRFQGLNFGLMMRDIFLSEDSHLDGGTDMTIVDDVLKKMIFGVKFEMSPIEVAAQFLFENYGVYLGGKWFVGPVTVGLSFMGILSEREVTAIDPITLKHTYEATDATKMKVGASVNYTMDAFGADIKGFYAMLGDKSGTSGAGDYGYISQIGVEPGFYYNVIPSHLRFKLDAGFYFFGYYNNDEKVDSGVNNVQFALQPQLFWNFLGTGAQGWGGTGIALRYRLVGGDAEKFAPISLNNKFDVNFSWSF